MCEVEKVEKIIFGELLANEVQLGKSDVDVLNINQ